MELSSLLQRLKNKNSDESGCLCLPSPQSSHCGAAMNVTKTRGRTIGKLLGTTSKMIRLLTFFGTSRATAFKNYNLIELFVLVMFKFLFFPTVNPGESGRNRSDKRSVWFGMKLRPAPQGEELRRKTCEKN